VILHAEDDAPGLRVFERPSNAFDRPADPFSARQAGVPLTAERAAMAGAKPHGQIDRRLLPIDLTSPFDGIVVGEIRGETDHRGDLAGLVHRPHDRVDIHRRKTLEEAVVVLDAFAAERRRVVNPPFVGPAALGEIIEIALGEEADPRRHRATLSQSHQSPVTSFQLPVASPWRPRLQPVFDPAQNLDQIARQLRSGFRGLGESLQDHPSSATGSPSWIVNGTGGSLRRISAMTPAGLPQSNAFRPVAISYMTAPKANRSDCAPASRPSIRSGARSCTVPREGCADAS
jgi:hypothetical protein